MRYLLILAALFSLSACSKVAFKIDDKQAVLKNNILGGGPISGGGATTPAGGTTTGGGGATTTGGGITTGDGTVNGGGTTSTGGATTAADAPDAIVTRHCSDAKTDSYGTNIASATSLVATIMLDDVVKCTLNSTSLLKSSLVAGILPVSYCGALANGTYVVSIIANGSKQMIVGAGGSEATSNGTFTLTNGALESQLMVLIDSNPDSNKSNVRYLGSTCDSKASPLFIDFRSDASDFDILSSPADGVRFDILGANGTPAYSKSQISWFQKGKFALLALPNSRGQVINIDQLFGDNTKGADGKFADNGFEALKKYDANHDGVIDRFDPVFTKLRLWFDVNRDGKADSSELSTLADKGVIAIDLEYDHNFAEKDKYGNEIKYKSIVKFIDGTLKSIFDLWFKL